MNFINFIKFSINKNGAQVHGAALLNFFYTCIELFEMINHLIEFLSITAPRTSAPIYLVAPLIRKFI